MTGRQRSVLEANGFGVYEDAADWLGMTKEERAQVEARLLTRTSMSKKSKSTIVTIRGHSDDYLTVIGGGLDDEFGAREGEPLFIGFSDGTLLRAVYDGEWHITAQARGRASYHHIPSAGVDSEDYSDVVTLEGDLLWVVAGERNRTS